MRIYIDNINMNKINTSKITKYLLKKDKLKEIYSDEGFFRVKNEYLCKQITVDDGEIIPINNYIDDMNIIIDKSFIYTSKEVVSHIPYNHIALDVYKYEYKESPESPVSFLIETDLENNIQNSYYMLTNKHAAYSDADIINPFTKESILFFHKLIFE